MITNISEGISISVESFYQADYSHPRNHEYLFAYRVSIENHNIFPIQLLRRQWYIFDSSGDHREVEGEGVVGVQPVIQPGESYQYVSGCDLKSDMGKMGGFYTMKNLYNQAELIVQIPSFDLITPEKLN